MLPDLLAAIVGFNVLLAVFNLVPIPPLDGSRVVTWLLPRDARHLYGAIEQYGILVIFGLILFVRPFQVALWNTLNFVESFLYELVTLWGLW
ncbi:site-2 protease family protein [Engelhardtia mirabilis]